MRVELLERVMAADFAAFDMSLFLDTHPNDPKGMTMLAEYQRQAAELRNTFVAQFGPLTLADSKGNGGWAANPWPWDVNQEV